MSGKSLLSESCCSLCTQPTLTGDWFGLRSGMKDSGVTFSGRSTHYGFAVDGGIRSAPPIPLPGFGDPSAYTGRGEYDLTFDPEKSGGLPHGSLLVRGEHWYGHHGNVSLNTGAFAPAVLAAATPPAPDDEGQLFLTNFILTQPLSENFVLYGGKQDVLGAADQNVFADGDGTDQFMNQALVANTAFLPGLPYTSFVFGAAMPQSWGMINVCAYDPKDRTQEGLEFDDMYSDGVILGGEIKVNSSLFELPGDVHVGGMWKHADPTDLRFNEPPPGVYPEPTVPGFPMLSDSWTIYTGFDQYLVQYSGREKKGWGLFGRASVSDANPTPIHDFLSAGVGGDSNLRAGSNDRWGAGWFFTGVSEEFGPIPRFLFAPHDETGVELYYNFQVTPWMNVTPDVQFIRPAVSALADEAYVYGVRVNVTL